MSISVAWPEGLAAMTPSALPVGFPFDRQAVVNDIVRCEDETWDVVIIGGGATGLGAALEAATRGYRTALLEAHDFAKGTSSRSTKLVHGGVRYLAQGNIGLVMDALRERGRLLANAPHIARRQAFIVPVYRWLDAPFYGLGLMAYDLLSGKLGLGRSRLLSRQEAIQRLPMAKRSGLKAGVLYYDGQFDDSRLAVTLAMSAADAGARLLNYAEATGFLKDADGRISGVRFHDKESGQQAVLRARVVINATGIFTDATRRLDQPDLRSSLALSQGVHLVLDRSFLGGEDAILVPKTADGRVLFAVPWHGRTIIGTTDTGIPDAALEPRPLPEEIAFLLSHAALYLEKAPRPEDVLAVFTGIRPLAKVQDGAQTASLARDHVLSVSPSGLITISGGKWTTYRKMGEETVNEAARVGGLPARPCATADLRLRGWTGTPSAPDDPLAIYGADAARVHAIMAERPGWADRLHPDLPYVAGEIIYAVRHEMARTVEDALARRTRALFLNAAAALAAAPAVAALMASELGQDDTWQAQQLQAFAQTAQAYAL
jgi:glycerol-3-phosphate dehydrogenase